MDQARASLRKTMKRLNRAYADSKSNHMLYLILFALALFFAVFFWNKARRAACPSLCTLQWFLPVACRLPGTRASCSSPGVHRQAAGQACAAPAEACAGPGSNFCPQACSLFAGAAALMCLPLRACLQVHRMLKWIF